MTVGTISARTGIGKGTLFSEYARLSERRISEVRSGVRESVARSHAVAGRGLEDGDYHDEAKRIKNEMLKMINAQAKDPGLQKCQDIFRRHPGRIFQWAENRSVPAEDIAELDQQHEPEALALRRLRLQRLRN